MNIKRLESARDFLFWLDEAPKNYLKEHFDMNWWGGPHNLKDAEAPLDHVIEELGHEAQCQTSACAIGWLGTVADNGGLFLIQDNCDLCDAKPAEKCKPYCKGLDNPWVRNLIPRYEHFQYQAQFFHNLTPETIDLDFKNRSGWDDISQYFDIEEHVAEAIFSPDSDRYDHLREEDVDICSDHDCPCRRDRYKVTLTPGDVARVIDDIIKEEN